MKEIRLLPTGYGTAFFHPADDALVTFGQQGLVRRPVKVTTDGGVRIEIGPPQELKAYWNSEPHLMIAGSRDGRLLVSDFDLEHGAALLFLPERPDPLRLNDLGVTAVALSPDGRWAATGGWYGNTLKIWDASNGRLVRTLQVDRSAPRFSPDSRRLVACTNTVVRTWDTTTWAEGPSLPRDQKADLDLNGFLSSPEFSPDGSILAVAYSSHQIKLLRADDLKSIATLESPDPRLAGELSFSPDGALLAVGTDNGAQVWDLRAIRARLAAMNLDWDLPSYPPAPTAEPLTLTVQDKPEP
jgi:WD40 repeat protein